MLRTPFAPDFSTFNESEGKIGKVRLELRLEYVCQGYIYGYNREGLAFYYFTFIQCYINIVMSYFTGRDE